MGASAWAADKTVVKYSFDDAMSPSLTAGSRVSFDYDKTSVITSTKFLNAWNNVNGDPGSSTVSLGSTDLSGETWTLSFEWAACGGCNSKADHTTLKAGDTNLFDLTGNSNWNTTVTITYSGSDGTKTLPVPGCDKGKRFSAAVGDQYNTTTYWHHIVVTGSAEGVKMTITNSSTGTAVVENIVLSETNVNPTSLIIEPCCGGGIGLDELSLTYFVEGEVIQTPVANYTAVNGASRTITATCETEGVTIQHSADGETFEDGTSITVSESGNVYFKAVKGTSESDVLTFAVVAGEITLNAPAIVRSDNTTVTITADQTNILLSPAATIYYTYGEESGSFTGSKTLTVAADATITAYAEAEGYTTSETSQRAVALFPAYVDQVENTAAKTSGWSANAFSEETITASERTYAALLLDGTQWGTNVYLQTSGSWGLRASGNWYINSEKEESWLLIQNMKKGDIVVVNASYPASSTVNATESKYSFGTQFAYEVTEDGNVELALKKINAATMDYFYGVYAYTPATLSATFEKPEGWSAVYAYTFNAEKLGGWPGTEIVPVDGVYTIEFESYDAPEKIIFHNNSGTQTGNLTFVNGGFYTYDGVYTVAGSEALLGSNWDVTKNRMTANGDGTYSLTLTGVDLSTSPAYKVVKNYSWDEAWPASDRPIGISMAGTYDITINFNPADGSVWETMAVAKEITAAGYATYCAPYALNFDGSGVKAYFAKKKDGNNVEFYEISNAPANTGLLLKADAGTYKLKMESVEGEAAANVDGNVLKGVLENTEVSAGSFVLMNGTQGVGFYKAASAFTVGANTAYIEALADGEARSFIGFNFGGETTAIEGIATVKENNGEVYNLQGQRVVKATKGLYIVNGKKVLLK